MVTMETDRLIMRDYKEADLGDMYRLWSDKKTMYYLSDILTDTIEKSAKYLKEWYRKHRWALFLHLRKNYRTLYGEQRLHNN